MAQGSRRPVRSDIATLLQEVRAIELLASEAEVSPERLQAYWDLSADLIALVTEVEEYERENPQASYEDPAMFTFKHRLRGITSRLAEIAEP
jgi:hypothetical protein